MASSTSRMLYVLIVLSFFAKASRANRIFNIELKGIPPQSYRNLSDVGIPDEVDWRNQGAVTPIKNQKDYSKCFAFAIVGAVEGITAISTGRLISLSEQQLVDCARCKGEIGRAFKYIIDHGGLITEQMYPYNGTAGKCKDNMLSAATIRGYKPVTSYSESALRVAVARQPIVARIASSHKSFKDYKSGVYNNTLCGVNLNHGVTVVGYGTAGADQAHQKYWLIKNSWGTVWGEGGYMRMKRDVGPAAGLCGIASDPYYPTV